MISARLGHRIISQQKWQRRLCMSVSWLFKCLAQWSSAFDMVEQGLPVQSLASENRIVLQVEGRPSPLRGQQSARIVE
jgi:hypothetical protein